MRFSADDYREAAEERAEDARTLYEAGRYALAHYTAGLAVECLLRAYRRRSDPDFDSRHDLQQLYVASGFMHVVSSVGDRQRAAALTWLDVLLPRWRNNHRYLSERSFRHFLKQEGLDRGVRGNYVKENSRLVVDAASRLVQLGVGRWLR